MAGAACPAVPLSTVRAVPSSSWHLAMAEACYGRPPALPAAGLDAPPAPPAEVAKYTVRTMLRTIPAAVPGIHFLSGEGPAAALPAHPCPAAVTLAPSDITCFLHHLWPERKRCTAAQPCTPANPGMPPLPCGVTNLQPILPSLRCMWHAVPQPPP